MPSKFYRSKKGRFATEAFAAAEMIITVNDEPLRLGLAQAEMVAAEWAGNTQKRLALVESEFGKVAVSSSRAATAMGGLGNTRMLIHMVGSEVSLLAGGLGVATKAISSLTTGIMFFGKAMWGPIGVILAAGAALAGLIDYFRDSKKAAADAKKELEDFAKAASEKASAAATQLANTLNDLRTAQAALVGGAAPVIAAGQLGVRGIEARQAAKRAELQQAQEDWWKLEKQITNPEATLAATIRNEPGSALAKAAQPVEARMNAIRTELEYLSKLRETLFAQGETNIARYRAESLKKEEEGHKRMIERWQKYWETAQGRVGGWWKSTALGTVLGNMQGLYEERKKQAKVNFILSMMGMPTLSEEGQPISATAAVAPILRGGSVSAREFMTATGGVAGTFDLDRKQLQATEQTAKNTGEMLKFWQRLGFGAK